MTHEIRPFELEKAKGPLPLQVKLPSGGPDMKRSQEVAHGFSVLPVRWPGEGLTHLTKEYSAFWMILNTPHQLHVLSASLPLFPIGLAKSCAVFWTNPIVHFQHLYWFPQAPGMLS